MNNVRNRTILKWALGSLGLIIVLFLAGLITLAISTRRFQATEKIARNVTVASVDVSDLLPAQARSLLERRWVPSLPSEVALIHPNGNYTVSREALGATILLDQAIDQASQIGRTGGVIGGMRTQLWLRMHVNNIPVLAWIDQDRLRATLGDVAEQIDCEPADAQVQVTDDNQVKKVPGTVGVTVQIDESLTILQEALTDPRMRSVELQVLAQPPTISTEDLANLEVVLSSYSTPFQPWKRSRTHNLRLAMSRVNKTMLKPGEEFSLNEIVGPRLSEVGYRNAPIFKDNEVVPEIGGGVCQVASTVYNAALLANLEILERQHHSRIVDYCPSGRDATVYYGQIDMRFKNSLEHPILILGGIKDNQLWTKILGKTSDDYDVKLIRTGLSRSGYETKEIPDPELEAGQREVEIEGHGGGRATLIREIQTKEGELVDRQTMHTDIYPSQTEVVHVGTKGAETEPGELEPAESGSSAARLESVPSSTMPPSN